jgi:hypothetical protein
MVPPVVALVGLPWLAAGSHPGADVQLQPASEAGGVRHPDGDVVAAEHVDIHGHDHPDDVRRRCPRQVDDLLLLVGQLLGIGQWLEERCVAHGPDPVRDARES